MNDAAAKFFGCTDQDMAEYRAAQEANRPVDPKTLIKQQFVMSKTNAQPGKLDTFHPTCFFLNLMRLCPTPVQKPTAAQAGDFQTSNNFYH